MPAIYYRFLSCSVDNWTFLFCNHQFSQYITALCLIYGRSVFLKITYSVIFRLVSLRFVSPLSAVRTFFFSLVPTFETCTIQNMSSSLSQLWWTWVLNAAVIKLQCSSCLSPETERNALCFLSSWSGCFFPPGSSCWSVGVSDVSLSPSFIISEEDTGLCLGPKLQDEDLNISVQNWVSVMQQWPDSLFKSVTWQCS